MSGIEQFEFDPQLWAMSAQSPAFPSYAGDGNSATSTGRTDSSLAADAITNLANAYSLSSNGQQQPPWALDASTPGWLGAPAASAPTSFDASSGGGSAANAPAPTAPQSMAGPDAVTSFLSPLPLSGLSLTPAAQSAPGSGSRPGSTASSAELGGSVGAHSGALAESHRAALQALLSGAGKASAAPMAHTAPALASQSPAPTGAAARADDAGQPPPANNAGTGSRAPPPGTITIPTSASSQAAAANHAIGQSAFSGISADTYANLINQANSTLYGPKPQQPLPGSAAPASHAPHASAPDLSTTGPLANIASKYLPIRLDLRTAPMSLPYASAAGVAAAAASPALPQYAFSQEDMRPQSLAPMHPHQPLQALPPQQHQQQHPLHLPIPHQLQLQLQQQRQQQQQQHSMPIGGPPSQSSAAPTPQVNGHACAPVHQPQGQQQHSAVGMPNGNGDEQHASGPTEKAESSEQAGPKIEEAGEQAPTANPDGSAARADTPSSSTFGFAPPAPASSAGAASPSKVQGYSPDDPYIPALGRGARRASTSSKITYREESPPELPYDSDDSADGDFGKATTSTATGRRKSGTGAPRGRPRTRKSAGGPGFAAPKPASAEDAEGQEGADGTFAPTAGSSGMRVDGEGEAGTEGASGEAAGDGSPRDGLSTSTSRKRATPPNAVDPVTGFMRRTTEIPAVEDDPTIRPYGCNWCFSQRKEAERAARRQRRAAESDAKGKGRAVEGGAAEGGGDVDADGETDHEEGTDEEDALAVAANDPQLPVIQWRTVKELREHFTKEHKDRPLKGKKEKEEKEEGQESTSPGDMPFRCSLIPCDKIFKSLAGLRFHFQNASTNGHFTVQIEQDAETGEERQTKKFKLDAKPSGRELKCPIPRCPKRFKQSAGLAYHLSHTPNHPVTEAMVDGFEGTLQSKTRWWFNRLNKPFAQP